ncbi:MAG: hypothetical protein ACLFS2_02405 [Halochromatium sp.]|uniref:hypothetical protein n=1 Tax=Halochromatium sp. TaxID=2049430 RepID=UPI00397CD6CE
MNPDKIDQLRQVREIRRQAAERELQAARRLVRRRESVVAAERRKLEALHAQCNELAPQGRPDGLANVGELLLADHQLRNVRQRIANQQQLLAKAQQACEQAREERSKACQAYRKRQQKVEGIDRQIEHLRLHEARRSERRAEDEAEAVAGM